jgi:hypothetical protein
LTAARSTWLLRGYEQRLGRSQTIASIGAGATVLVASAHQSRHRHPSGDGQRVSESGRHSGARLGRTPAGMAPKTAHHTEGVHRPWRDAAPGRAPSANACEPYRELIAEALGRGRNAMAIWQDLVDGHGFTARYASVRRFVAALRGTASTEARVVITTAPGEEGQVDYGDGPIVRHPRPASTGARASSF